MFSHCRDLSKTNTWQHPIWTLSKSLSGKDEIKTKKTKTSTVSKRSPINENVSCLKIVTKYMRPCFFFVFFGGGQYRGDWYYSIFGCRHSVISSKMFTPAAEYNKAESGCCLSLLHQKPSHITHQTGDLQTCCISSSTCYLNAVFSLDCVREPQRESLVIFLGDL